MNARYHYHPAQKQGFIKFVYRAGKNCDQESLAEEKAGLTLSLKQDSYNNRTIYRALKHVNTTQKN